MHKILTLNNISPVGLDRFPRNSYEVASEIVRPDAIMLRSFKMHDMELPVSLQAVGRAGAGVNNIPVEKMSALGVPVFNAPGANANAVKELVLAGLLMAARNIPQAWEYTRQLEGDDAEVAKAVEAGKKKYVGYELPGRTLGVIGLGAIGYRVANAALKLGMNVVGFDPALSVTNAWQLSSGVQKAVSVDDLMSRCDFVTVHVPLIDQTRGLINAERINLMNDGAVVLNFSRDGIVDTDATIAALDAGKLSAYVCDFPTNAIRNHGKVIALPHLGASTAEAEDNCAIMVADQLRGFLDDGNIVNSVNFPEAVMPRASGTRITIANANVPNMIGQVSTDLAKHGINIIDLLNKSRGEIAYSIVDVEPAPSPEIIAEIAGIEGVLKVRVLD
jgi:D-3-phosphoglycerate dehydrogenase